MHDHFYGYGFGFFGELGVALGLMIAFVIYSLQLLFANLYVQRFTIGPVEWILRKFVYLAKGRAQGSAGYAAEE